MVQLQSVPDDMSIEPPASDFLKHTLSTRTYAQSKYIQHRTWQTVQLTVNGPVYLFLLELQFSTSLCFIKY